MQCKYSAHQRLIPSDGATQCIGISQAEGRDTSRPGIYSSWSAVGTRHPLPPTQPLSNTGPNSANRNIRRLDQGASISQRLAAAPLRIVVISGDEENTRWVCLALARRANVEKLTNQPCMVCVPRGLLGLFGDDGPGVSITGAKAQVDDAL